MLVTASTPLRLPSEWHFYFAAIWG